MKHIVVLLIVSTVLMSACTGTKWVRTSVAKEYDFAVALEQRPVKEAITPQKQERTKRLELTELKSLLSELKYIEEGGALSKSTQATVFQTSEIDRLSPALLDALAKADANQRVRFLSFNQGQGVIFSNSRKTEGVVFFGVDGQLNIAFNYINSKRLPSETSAIYVNFSDVDPLSIQSADNPLVTTAPYLQSHKFAAGQTAPLWVVADLDKLEQTIISAPPPVAAEVVPTAKAPAETPPAAVPMTAPAAVPVENNAAIAASEDVLRRDIKDKLEYLKELFDEGLISEQDYQRKKQDLLDKID
jgi:serine protease inhibitor ecotin